MKLGFIGLGKMGKAMVINLLEKGIDVSLFNRSIEKTRQFEEEMKLADTKGILTANVTVEELVKSLPTPRVIWLMVPQGAPVDEMIEKVLTSGVAPGDTIIDGGNSFYKDSVRRYKYLSAGNIKYLDIGTSGGIEGARNGACLMIGGDIDVYQNLIPLFDVLAGEGGTHTYFGPAGAGHFVKMVHNGVEYGMLQAIAEGFEILNKGPYSLDLAQVASNWRKGSVVRGWLLDLLERALMRDKREGIKDKRENEEYFKEYSGSVGGGTTGEWTVETAKELGVEAKVIEESLNARKKSQTKPAFAGKVVSALRNEFGGHK